MSLRAAASCGACALLMTALAVAPGPAGATPAAAATPSTSGTYHPVAPTRILDTLDGTGGPRGALAANSEVILQVGGAGPVPAGVSAAVLNVTVTQPSSTGVITVYPDGLAKAPLVSNLNFVPHQTVPNLVVVRVPANGRVHLLNGSSGSVHLLADVSGYYTGSDAPSRPGAFGDLAPDRVLDTRHAIGAAVGPVEPGGAVAFSVTGDVPTGVAVSAVVLNVTVTGPSAPGSITAYADGGTRPTASNLNFRAHQTVPNLVVAPVGDNGKVALYNGSGGTVNLIADIAGYFLAGDPLENGTLGALAPTRLLDTRLGIGASRGAVGPGQARILTVGGRGGVPLARVSAVILNVTAVAPSSSGYLTVTVGATPAGTSNVNFVAGQVVPNLVVAQVSSGGTVTIVNRSPGTVHLVADVAGYVLGADAPLPRPVSRSRYVRNLTGADSVADAATMKPEGCQDAKDASSFVLLDIGAQTVTAPLSPSQPGVLLTATSTRLTYQQLHDAIQGYVVGFAMCKPQTATVTIAVGTNNDGAFTGSNAYPADQRGTDWADQLIAPLRSDAPTGITVLGANDIESGFAGDEAQAEQWERAYLAGTTAGPLVYNGSADGCPTDFGATGRVCGNGWTEANYYALTHGISPGHIQALPQIYTPEQAVQWADIDASGGGGIVFAGALTEFSVCPTATSPGCTFAILPPAQSWARLWHAASTVASAPSVPVVTDLQVDS